MIVTMEIAEEFEMTKPVICPKCERGRIGSIPVWGKTTISKRGKPPPAERNNNGVQVKCPKCKALWKLTIE